ncbi:nitrate reductase molybdenum cofactor assembly chaperone [Sulfuricella sp.]|uniref:nitrate reductase molybdenum cofactor assembly chaperone n=1 Tax=Sulfuricella sp. TaxID=2099377 RepID=UPI002CFF72F8|nr:nitrate reductase molybdenum cofactor assembly chaperone [Sulfuricella sp.]HUX63076.1 nitrate reductase molybdenum cofactor assembly chaperone [Sulfuricella sp.]
MTIYKLLSVLLEYPDRELFDNLPEIRQALDDCLDINEAERAVVRKALARLENGDPTEIQADYVQTFDLTPQHSLHLTHHLFGDDKNRGPALIDLSELYKDYGVEVAGNELPDYLPLILEFAAYQEDSDAQTFLSDAVKVFGVLASNLEKANSHYAPLVRIIENRASLTRLAA